MSIIRSNAIRIKRFRELKADLRTRRDRLLVGIDVAKAQCVAQVQLAHTRVLERAVTLPNTTAGFTALWRRLQRHQVATRCGEIVCALEPTGTYHQALAQFLDAQGADVVLVAPQVAHANRSTLDGTWDKNDPKDAANLCDLLERGRVLFYSVPDEPLASLRRVAHCLRRARVELAASKARWQNTLRPALAPTGTSLPADLIRALPAPVVALLADADCERRRGRPPRPASLPPGFTADLADLAARLTGVRARIRALEAAAVRLAAALPAYALLLSLPGVGRTVAALLVAEIGDIGWYTKFSQLRKLAGLDIVRLQSGRFAGQPRISKCGRPLLRWALYQAAVAVCRNPAWRARRAALIAKRHGDPHAFFKATIELAAKLLRLVWGVWRSGRPYDPTVGRAGVLAWDRRRQLRKHQRG
jgi:transposase